MFQRRAAIDSADFGGINDDEMLEAVLEMSRQEAGLSAPPPMEDEPTSSPDTGFGDTDAHDLAYHTDLLETDTKQPAGSHRDVFLLELPLLVFQYYTIDVSILCRCSGFPGLDHG